MTYLSGPMTGYKDLNRSAFKGAYYILKGKKEVVINPHNIGDLLFVPQFLPCKMQWFIYMFFDVIALLFCRKIYMLRGWENSEDACVEFKIAKFLKMEIEYESR